MPITLSNFGVPTGDAISDRGGLLMPKIKNRFRVSMLNFGRPDMEVYFTQQVVTASRPTVNFAPQTVHSYNSTAYYAGKAEWQEVTVAVRDDISNSIATLVGTQVQRQMNFYEQTVPGMAGSYKFSMLVDMLDGGGTAQQNAQVYETWYFEGCFLASVNYQTLDYSSADAMTVEMGIRYDNAFSSVFPQNVTDLLGNEQFQGMQF